MCVRICIITVVFKRAYVLFLFTGIFKRTQKQQKLSNSEWQRGNLQKNKNANKKRQTGSPS